MPKPVSASVPISIIAQVIRQLGPQAAHLPHVLLVVHGVDHRAGAEEQQRLEEGVGEQVEHAGLVGADAAGDEHVAELRAGRIGDDALDVVLHQADGRREERGDRADERRRTRRHGRVLEDRRQPATMNTPAVTMVAAWISAETGVGPSMASGSQVCRKNCADLPMAPMNKSRHSVVRMSTW